MTALLEVKDLRVHLFTGRGVVRAVDGIGFSLEAGRSLGIVGEFRLRQEHDGVVTAATDPTASGAHCQWSDPVRWRRRGEYECGGTARIARQPHRHDLPGPDDDTEPGVQHRRTNRGIGEAASRRRTCRRDGASDRDVAAGRHSRSCARGGCLSAPAFRRDAPARGDRHGARLRSEAVDCRRTHHGTGRDHSGADSGTAASTAEQSSAWR